MEKPDKFYYQAFISYRHRRIDREHAQWLLEAIETFETPERLRQEGYPARIGKLFRDDDELDSVQDLTPAVKEALWKSNYLLVICGVETPSSAWVRAEIKLFQHWGRGEQIIPILIEGTVQSSFPPELLQTQIFGTGLEAEFTQVVPRGPDLTKRQGQTEDDAKERALLTICAAILGCAFPHLKSRVEERAKKLTSVEYYMDFTWKDCAPFGLIEISEAHSHRRSASFCFERISGLVKRVRRVNGHGVMSENSDGICIWDIRYRRDGSVEHIDHRNRYGSIKLRERVNLDGSIVDFFYEDETSAPVNSTFSDVSPTQAQKLTSSKSSIVRFLVKYDEFGFVASKRFFRDTFNTPQADSFGNFGVALDRDESGFVLREWALDAWGNPAPSGHRAVFRATQYNDVGLAVRVTFTDAQNAKCNCKLRYSEGSYSYDDFGNTVKVDYYDLEGRPISIEGSHSSVIIKRDYHGNAIEEEFFLPSGKHGPCSRIKYEYDDRGNLTRETRFRHDGHPGLDGQHRVTEYSYDHNNYLLVKTCLDPSGNRVNGKDGICQNRFSYDLQGNLTQILYTGEDGERVKGSYGFSQASFIYNTRGAVIEERYYGPSTKLIENTKGYACLKNSYDLRGNRVKSEYFGVDDKPITSLDGYACASFLHDDGGNLVEERFLCADNEPALCSGQYASARYARDDRGKIVERSFYGVDGERVLNTEGYSRCVIQYDASGQGTDLTFLGVDDRPIEINAGYDGFPGYSRISTTIGKDNEHNLAAYDTEGRIVLQTSFTKSLFQEKSNRPVAITDEMLTEDVVICIQGVKTSGESTYCYLKLSLQSLFDLKMRILKKEPFIPSEFGTILKEGSGSVPLDVQEEMSLKHDMMPVDIIVEAY